MNPTQFIQPAFFNQLFEKNNTGELEVKSEYLVILNKLALLDKANEIVKALRQQNLPAPPAKFNSTGASQEEAIGHNVMPAINYILHSIQSFIVASKTFINWSASKILGEDTDYKLSFSAQEELEVMRTKLTQDSISIVDVAKLFKVDNSNLELISNIALPECFKGSFDTIAELLKDELIKDGGDLGANLTKLQKGNEPHWYDFKFLENTNYRKVVEIFKACMAYMTDLLIDASSILKGVANFMYHFHKENQDLFNKNASEIVSELNRDRGNNALDWAQLTLIIKQQAQSNNIN